jgi:hypothetical protein
MANHNLTLTDYYDRDNGGILDGAYAFNDGRLQFWNPVLNTWADTHINYLLHRIMGIQTEEPTHLHLFTEIDKKTAISLKQDIAEPILTILRALLPLYEMTIT